MKAVLCPTRSGDETRERDVEASWTKEVNDVNRALIHELATAAHSAARDVLLLGPPGTGKSHLAQAFGRGARNRFPRATGIFQTEPSRTTSSYFQLREWLAALVPDASESGPPRRECWNSLLGANGPYERL